jgi:hypothetical protein
MNQSPQLDLHPDADSLNAFVEHALAGPEREQVLAHIAACSRCRQVVYLVQEAAAEVEAHIPTSVPAQPDATPRNPWFRNWRVTWIAAAACVAIIVLAITLSLRQKTPATEVAKAVPAERESIQKPLSQAQKRPEAAQPAIQAAIRPSSRTNAPKAASDISKFTPLRTPPEALPAQPSSISAAPLTPSPAATTTTVDVSSAQLAAQIPPLMQTLPTQPTSSPDQLVIQSSITSVLDQQALSKRKAASTTLGLMKAKNAPAAGVKSAAPLVVANQTQGAQVSAAAMRAGSETAEVKPETGLQAVAGTTYFNATVGPQPISPASFSSTDMTVAQNAMHTLLPNGLTAVSTATAQHHLLAIDAIGNVFLSGNSGSNWELIAPQWTGHVVQVRSHPLLEGNEARMASPERKAGAAAVSHGAAARATAAASAAVFEIVNDSASVWTSSDGKIWKAK